MLSNSSIFFVTRFVSGTNISSKLSCVQICNDNLLTKTEVIMGFALNDIGTKTGMNALMSVVNPYNSPAILLSKKVEDTVYNDIKESTSHASGLNSSLDDLFVDSNVMFGRVQISTQYSTYLKEGIYNHPDVKK